MNRRQYLFLSTGAAVGSLVASEVAPAQVPDESGYAASGLTTGDLKPLRHTEVPGFLSAEQIAPHHSAHYGGALRAFMNVESEFDKSFETGAPIKGPAFDRMKQIQSSRGNSVLLHELYFDGLALKRTDTPEAIRTAVAGRFGSLEKWAVDFVDSARTAAGWAMLVVHPVNGKLYNVVSDEHAQGPLWLAAPLVVIDVYEHAFYIDYENRKGDYVETFLDFVDWDEADRRYRQAVGSA
jgi:Fe-Mn family superoxide dismutase